MNSPASEPGHALPLGSTIVPRGVNFSLFSRHATAVSLLIYDEPGDAEPAQSFVLDPGINKTGDLWHILLPEATEGSLYLYRIDGPFAPEKGHRFNPNAPLLDPYAKALSGDHIWDLDQALAYDPDAPEKDLAPAAYRGAAHLPKGVVVSDEFDWGNDRPLNYPMRESIIYEAHLRGLTAHPTSEAKHPGTYRGVIEMIPYLKELGITSLELLPVQEFDEFENFRTNPLTGEKLKNYWGYSTIAFFAPKANYSSGDKRGGQVREFKEMVKALHQAGIEVILDIVFNHSAEGNELGPTLSFRGIDNSIYYILESNRRYYANYSGCGNTMNCNHPIMRNFIVDCLRYWVTEMHVDGFRFDLASILGRDAQGNLMENPPILERIAEEPILRGTKIIAEAWDAAGAYQVGSFPGDRWSEWNDRFRDDVRKFWRGDTGLINTLATRFAGSSDLYLRNGRKPFHSINFVTSHDGFTLRDLVSYNRKHNEANGENNQDGHNSNYSYNHGVEGETDDPKILRLRNRQMKNFLATLLLSLGTPMLLSGDEFARSQGGNNNAYCQDNEISWNNYALGVPYMDIFRFTRLLILLRRNHSALTRPEFYTGRDNNASTRPDISWFTREGQPMDWARGDSCLAIYIDGSETETVGDEPDDDFYILINGSRHAHRFSLPTPRRGHRWTSVINTALEPPHDIREAGWEDDLWSEEDFQLLPRSMALLQSRPT
ncbi:MAG: glycogen debranching protein GlgX [Alkalispirochaetaceae bacterium]